MTELELNNDKTDSITLKKDSKGNYNWDIKIYFNEETEDKAMNRIQKINTDFKNVYNVGD